MSFSSLLIHKCDVARRTYGAADTHGMPIETWSNVYTQIATRFTQQISFTGIQGYEYDEHKRVNTHQDIFFFHKNVVINTQDRITNVLRKNGTVMDAGPFDVEEVRIHSNSKTDHHVEVVCKRIKAGGT